MNEVQIPSTNPFTIKNIEAWENFARLVGQPIDIETKHFFSKGIYARQIFIPKGVILTGKIHKFSQLNILLSGEIEVSVDNHLEVLKAPFVIVSPPGTKRIARTLEDCIWLTVHGTEEIDLSKIEDQFIAQNEQEYMQFLEQQPLLPFKET